LSRTRPNSAEHRTRYSFGEFTLDLEAGFLRRGNEEVPLRPKSFQVLCYLVERQGHLVSKSDLMDAVWPDAAITDNSLAQCLIEIRRALHDEDQTLIRTVKGRGYVFTRVAEPPVIEMARHGSEVVVKTSRSAQLSAIQSSQRKRLAIAALCASVAIGGGLFLVLAKSRGGAESSQKAVTDFTDSAVGPAVSPDGRLVAFFRSDDWWLTPDPIYIKMLPAGEPVKLTGDPRQKCCIAFSPDSKSIAYTAYDPVDEDWKTYTVPVLGGEPTLLLANAAGLTWLDQRRFLFSEIRTGLHMGLVTASTLRSGYQSIYFPKNERAMVHFSFASPDKKWALLVEKDPDWQPCRLNALDGVSEGRQVGPPGACTSAGWSPDGEWMYFSVLVAGGRHLWRQRFPDGRPQQLTFGPTEEEGIAVARDGSLITSSGMTQTAIWLHEASGVRQISSDGQLITSVIHGILPKFTADGKQLFYLKRRYAPASGNELWRTRIDSGKSEQALPGVSMAEFDISSEGKEVVYSVRPASSKSEIWLGVLDRSSPPQHVSSSGDALPHFGPNGGLVVQAHDGEGHYVTRMNPDASGRTRVSPNPISGIQGISPDRRWIAAVAPTDGGRPATVAIDVLNGETRRICSSYCPAAWSPDGKFLYVGVEKASREGPGKTLALPVVPGKTLPPLPASGIRGPGDVGLIPGARLLDAWELSPSNDPSVYAFVKTTAHRNLLEVPLSGR
jgi:DNA-binding winged helix-turn-helix (wHTH) protein